MAAKAAVVTVTAVGAATAVIIISAPAPNAAIKILRAIAGAEIKW